MWIKEPSKQLEDSGHDNLNFLFSDGKFYIMDNHLAAAWCWLQKIDVKSSYNLMHIDKHYDLIENEAAIKTEITNKKIDLPTLNLGSYLDLIQPLNDSKPAKLFRYDNYIGNVKIIYPKLFDKCYFATHKDGVTIDNFIYYEPEIYDMETNIFGWLKMHSNNKWIINIDIDYFYNENGYNDYYQFLTDEYIKCICEQIKRSLDYIEVITIAMSPSFCNGWTNSYKSTKIISDYFDLPFSLNIK